MKKCFLKMKQKSFIFLKYKKFLELSKLNIRIKLENYDLKNINF